MEFGWDQPAANYTCTVAFMDYLTFYNIYADLCEPESTAEGKCNKDRQSLGLLLLPIVLSQIGSTSSATRDDKDGAAGS